MELGSSWFEGWREGEYLGFGWTPQTFVVFRKFVHRAWKTAMINENMKHYLKQYIKVNSNCCGHLITV